LITEYLLPESAEKAVAELGAGVIMGGGTTVMPAALAGALDATRVVGLARAGLDTVERQGGRTTLGAMTTLAAVAALENAGALSAAAAAVGGPALRNMATVGGNLVIGGDVATALLALGAEVTLTDRTVAVDELELQPGELIRSVTFEDDPDSVFLRCARRAANSPAVVSVAVSRGRVALGGVADRPMRSPGAEAGDPARAAQEIDPPTDAIASAWYRRRMTELFVRRALEASHAV